MVVVLFAIAVVKWRVKLTEEQKGCIMNIGRTILKITEWQSASGRWYAADTTGFSGWWTIARMLDMELGKYAKFLV